MARRHQGMPAAVPDRPNDGPRQRTNNPCPFQKTPMKLARPAGGPTLALGFVACAQAQTTMRISISVGKDSHLGVGIDVFASEVE